MLCSIPLTEYRLDVPTTLLLPITDETRGHGTHSIPAIWDKYLAELLDESAKR
jgi:hypothetical protein